MVPKLMLAFLIGIPLSRAEEQYRDISIVTASVTDRENAPIEGAAVYKLNWFEATDENPTPVISNALGVFELPIGPSAPGSSNYVIIHRDGFGFGALNLDALPARVRLFPRRSIALRILDAEGRNVHGARVTPGEIAFSEEFLHAMVPRALAEKTGAVSRSDGWATLRSTHPSSLRSLVVEVEGYGAQIFPCDFSDKSKFRILRLHDTTPLEIKLMKGADPASGWKAVGEFYSRESQKNYRYDSRYRSGATSCALD